MRFPACLRVLRALPVLLVSLPVAVIPSPYYAAQLGTAVLTNRQRLVGRFYYHTAPFSPAVSFYYYAHGPASQRLIPVADVQLLTVSSRRDTTQHRTFQRRNGHLIYQPRHGQPQEITRELFTF